MKLFRLLFILLVPALLHTNLEASITNLSPSDAENLGINVSVFEVENSPESTIGFSLDTNQFGACEIDSVYLALISSAGLLEFGGEIAPRNKIYNFQFTPQYLDRTTVGIGCKGEIINWIEKAYNLHIGEYVKAP